MIVDADEAVFQLHANFSSLKMFTTKDAKSTKSEVIIFRTIRVLRDLRGEGGLSPQAPQIWST
jgi:hypothetical protein